MTVYSTIQKLLTLDNNSKQEFTSVFILKRKSLKTTKTGNPYLNVEFADATGSFSTNVFTSSNAYLSLEDLSEGSLVQLSAQLNFYNGQLSPDIQSLIRYSFEEAQEEGIAHQLIELPPETESELWQTLLNGLDQIKHSALKKTVESALSEHQEQFKTSSAAISMHHAYRHGLLEHTVHMLKVGLSLLPIYPEVDSDLAIAGIILHDIGKIEEYDGEYTTEITRKGLLQGHVVLGYKIIRKAALLSKLNEDLTERLEHIILSHQGEKEWGAAAMAATPEAVFVSMIDNLDARMGMVQRSLRKAPENSILSDYLPGLKTKLLLTPPKKN